jgi:antitoxin FitA
MEQILVRNLPPGTKAALKVRAELNHRSLEAEAREILAEAANRESITLVDLISGPEEVDVEFAPSRLGLSARSADL